MNSIYLTLFNENVKSKPSQLGLYNMLTTSLQGSNPAPSKCLGYDTKQSDGEAPVLEFWGMRDTPLLPLLSGAL